jgi:site-specific DNA recombinase
LADVKVAIYARQSVDRTGDELAVTRQEEDARTLAQLRGWQIVRVLIDNDKSAKGHISRPGFEALLELLERGDAEGVIAWDLTRLTRNRRDQLRLIETCEKRSVTIALVRGSDIDMSTPAGRLVADILSAQARHEIDQKSDRQRRALLQAAERGERVGGRKPFGYEQDGVTIIPEEADAIRWGFNAVNAGVSLAEIAREWNRRGHSGQRRPWAWDSVRAVLTNPRYYGRRILRDGVSRSSEIIVDAPAAWEAIVEEEVWRAAQDVFSGRAAVTPPRGAKRLLTGLGLCGGCGATVHAGGAFGRYPMYRCSAYTRSPDGKADRSVTHVTRKALPVEAYVCDVAVGWLSRPEAADLVIDRGHPDAKALREQAATLRDRRENLAVDYADGTLTKSQMRTANERLSAQIAEIEAQLADAGRVDALGPLIAAADVAAAWRALSVAQQRVVIDMLMTVRLDPPGRGVRVFRPETVRIEWKA